MRIKRNDLTRFTDIGTVVLYPTRPFVPELYKGMELDWSKFFDITSSSTYLHSTNLNSEYIDFAKYSFEFNLASTKYWSTLYPNLFDYSDTSEKFGKDFDSRSVNLIPQLGTKTTIKEEKHFFGKLKDAENTIYLIHVPAGFWKVEVYDSRLVSNNNLGQPFLDWELLEMLDRSSIVEEPLMTITFGPPHDVSISNLSYNEMVKIDDVSGEITSGCREYLGRYIYDGKVFLTKEIYDSFDYQQNYISDSKYYQLHYEEIESEKLLYIINSTNGELKTVDMFSAAYLESSNKFRHLNENVVRNDEKLGDRIFSSSSRMTFDLRSNTLLGVKGSMSDCPLFVSRYNSLPDSFYSRSSAGNHVWVMGKEWVREENQPVLGENPEISPFWISPKDIKKSMFLHYYVLKEGKGTVKPCGMVSVREDRELVLTIEPNIGHEFLELQGVDKSEYRMEGDKLILRPEEGTRMTVIFGEIGYTVNINLICEVDHVYFGETRTYTLADFEEIGLELWYYDYDKDEDVRYVRGPIRVTEPRPLKFWINSDNSLYYLPNPQRFYFLLDPDTLLGTEEEYSVVDINVLSDPLLEDILLQIANNIRTKTYFITVNTGNEVQVSTKKKTELQYGDPYEAMFTYENGKTLTLDMVSVINRDTNEVERPGRGVWTLEDIGNGIIKFTIPERTKENSESGVKHNYQINVDV